MDVPASANDLKFKATILRKAKGFKLEMFSEAVAFMRQEGYFCTPCSNTLEEFSET
jgi:hypothetical protein